MRKTQTIERLKDCKTEKEVRMLFSGFEISKTNSCFEDHTYYFPAESINTIKGAKIRLGNTLLDLSLRVFYLLKAEGHILYIPKNTGKLNHFNLLHVALSHIEEAQPNIYSLLDITPATIDHLVNSLRSKGTNPTAIMDKVRALFNTARSTAELPSFLQININAFMGSKELNRLEEEARIYNDKLRKKAVGGKRELHDIRQMLELCKKAVHYFDSHKEDAILASKMYISSKRGTPEATYSALFDAFLSSNHTFSEPVLREISESIKKNKRKYGNKKTEWTHKQLYQNLGRSTPKLLYRVKTSYTRLETACTIIVAITTATRSGELFTLGRHPVTTKVEDGEYYLLEKTVYKTAGTEQGEIVHVPIPEIAKNALETLSEMGDIFGIPEDGILFWGETGKDEIVEAKTLNILNRKLKRFGDFFGIKETPTMHDFRHAMAFVVAYLNEREGIELVGLLLGHTSREMTLDYLGYFNEAFEEVMAQKYKEGGKELVKEIGDSLRSGGTLYGKQGEKIMNSYVEYQQFTGGIVEDFADIFEEGTNALLDKGHIGVIQTSMCVCIHDLTKPEKMACQKGFGLENLTGTNPIPSRCQGVDCGSSIFREVDIDSIEEPYIDEDLKKRLSNNRVFKESGGFENETTIGLLNKYKQNKMKGAI